MVRKVMAGQELLKAAGTVSGKLVRWLAEQGHIDSETAADVSDHAREAARDLPTADRLGMLLHDACEEPFDLDPDQIADEDWVEEHLTIVDVEPGRIWFEGGVGPIEVPAAVSDLARPGWQVLVTVVRIEGRWLLLGSGSSTRRRVPAADSSAAQRLALITGDGAPGSFAGRVEDLADPDARTVAIRADHPELDRALREGRQEIVVDGEPMSVRLHLTIHEVLASQLIDDDPPEVYLTARRLLAAGSASAASAPSDEQTLMAGTPPAAAGADLLPGSLYAVVCRGPARAP